MTAGELFKAGRLADAIAAQIDAVRASPGDNDRRLFLFELFAFAGDLDKARRQLDAVKYDDTETDLAVQPLRKILEAEAMRRKLFAEGVRPNFLAAPLPHVTMRLDALDRLREGHTADAAKLLAEANEAVAALEVTLNDKSISGLRDGDDVFGTVLEVFAQGKYFWLPVEQIDTLAMKAPSSPRDILYAPARIEMNGSMGEIFVANLYPGTHAHADDAIRLGRATDWSEGDVVRGVGARTFLAGEDAVGLLDWRELVV